MISLYMHSYACILKLCKTSSVCPTIHLFSQNRRLNFLLCPAWLKSAGHIVFALSVRPSVCLSVRPCVRPTFCRHYSDETVRRSILIFIYVIPNILKLCTLVSVCPSVRLFGQNWRLDLGNFSLIYIVNSKSCRHYSSETVRRSILIFIYVIPNILKLWTLVSVCPSVRLFGQNWRLDLGNFSLIYIVNTKSCRHYSSETVWRSILIFMYAIPNILKLCTLVSVGPFNWPKLTSELRQFFTYLHSKYKVL